MTAATKKGGNSAVKEKSFCILLKVSWYKFKLECYNFRMINVIPMVATEKIAIEYRQKEMRNNLSIS